MASAKPSVSRSRIGIRAANSRLPQAVADPADRLDRVTSERPVDLLAQGADIDADHVRAALEREIPRAVEQLRAREGHARAAHEQLEQRELLARESELVLAAPRTVRRRIEPQLPDLHHHRALGGSTAGERPQAGEQLLERERLREV